MDRKDFLKRAGILGVASALDFSGIKSVLAQGKTEVQKTADLVAVMGGEPAAMLDKALAEIGGMGKYVKKGNKVVIKPNIGWDRTPDLAANTNPELVGAMVRKCLAAGAAEVIVFDHTCDNWQNCYQKSGIKKEVEDAGGKMIPGNDEAYYVDYDLPAGVKLKKVKIHKAILDCDVWFNMPVLKNHGGAKMTVSMKNLMGIIWDRGWWHQNDLQQCIADMCTLAKKPALHIVDAYRIVTDKGPQSQSLSDVETPKSLFVSADPVAVDTASVKFFNQFREMEMNTVSHIEKAQSLKLGTMNLDALNVKRIKI